MQRFCQANILPGPRETKASSPADLPENATHFVFNLVDENQFLVSYPKLGIQNGRRKSYSEAAIATGAKSEPKAIAEKQTKESSAKIGVAPAMFKKLDANKDSELSREEFVTSRESQFCRKDKDGNGFLDKSEHQHDSFELASLAETS